MPKVETLHSERGNPISGQHQNYVSKNIGNNIPKNNNTLTKIPFRGKRDLIDNTKTIPKRRVVKKLVRVHPINETAQSSNRVSKEINFNHIESQQLNNLGIRNSRRRRKRIKIKKRKRLLHEKQTTEPEGVKKRRKVIVTRKRLLLKTQGVNISESTSADLHIIPTKSLDVFEMMTEATTQSPDVLLVDDLNDIPSNFHDDDSDDIESTDENTEQELKELDGETDDVIDQYQSAEKFAEDGPTRLEFPINDKNLQEDFDYDTEDASNAENVTDEEEEDEEEDEDDAGEIEDDDGEDEDNDGEDEDDNGEIEDENDEDEDEDNEDEDSEYEYENETTTNVDENETITKEDENETVTKIDEDETMMNTDKIEVITKEDEDETTTAFDENLPEYEPFFPELSESLDTPILLLKTTILSSTDYETKTVYESKNRTYTFVVTKVSGDEQTISSTTEVKPHTKTVIVTEPIIKYTTLTLLDLDSKETLPYIPLSVSPENITQEGRGLEEARYNLATRVMSNGVEVIVAGDKSTLPGDPDVKRILPSSIYKPVTLKPSTLSDHMMMLMPQDSSNIEILSSSLYPNQFVTKTCLTTFTYLTTYLENGTTAVSSHEQVVSNIATEERNTGKILPTPSMGITLTQYPNLSVGIFPTTYTYLNTILDGEQPLVVTSKHTVVNTVTAPDDYLSLLQPLEKASPEKETNTYYSTVFLEKTLYEGNESKVISTDEIVTQVVITESIPPKGTSIMTSYIALDVENPDENALQELKTTDVVKTYYVTYTYYNTIIENGKEVVQTNVATSPDVLTEKLYLHNKRTKVPSISKDVTSSAQIIQESKKEDKIESDTLKIYATKTYLTTFTHLTTMLTHSKDDTSTIVSSHLRVVENIVTETIDPGLLDKKYLSSLKEELKDTNALTKLATINGQKIEITVVIDEEKIQPTKVLPIKKTVMPELASSSIDPSIDSSSPNVITGSTIIFFDEDDDPFKQVSNKPTPSLNSKATKITKSTVKNNLNSLLSSEIVTKPSKNTKRHASRETIIKTKPVLAASISRPQQNIKVDKTPPGKKKPTNKINPSNNQVSDLLGLGSININRLQVLTPVLNVMADLLQNNLKIGSKNETSTTTAKPVTSKNELKITPKIPEKTPPRDGQNRSPIYIPVGGFTDIEVAESQNIASFQINEQVPWENPIAKGKITHESPLLNGGIPISPGEVITANSDVIVGKPGRIGPRIPSIPLNNINAEEVPIGMKPPPPIPERAQPTHSTIPIRYDRPSHPILHAPNKDDYVGPPPPHNIQVRPLTAVRGEKHKINDYIPLSPPPANNVPINFNNLRDQNYENIHTNTHDESQFTYNNGGQPLILGTPINEFNIKPSVLNEPIVLPEVIERSTGQPLLVNIQPSQVAFVNIPHNRTTALIYGGSIEPHRNGQYFDDPSPYPEPEFSGIENFNNGLPVLASVYNSGASSNQNQKEVGGVIKVATQPINIQPSPISVNVRQNLDIQPSKPNNLLNEVHLDSNSNKHDIQIHVPPISFGTVHKDNDFDGYVISHGVYGSVTKEELNNVNKEAGINYGQVHIVSNEPNNVDLSYKNELKKVDPTEWHKSTNGFVHMSSVQQGQNYAVNQGQYYPVNQGTYYSVNRGHRHPVNQGQQYPVTQSQQPVNQDQYKNPADQSHHQGVEKPINQNVENLQISNYGSNAGGNYYSDQPVGSGSQRRPLLNYQKGTSSKPSNQNIPLSQNAPDKVTNENKNVLSNQNYNLNREVPALQNAGNSNSRPYMKDVRRPYPKPIIIKSTKRPIHPGSGPESVQLPNLMTPPPPPSTEILPYPKKPAEIKNKYPVRQNLQPIHIPLSPEFTNVRPFNVAQINQINEFYNINNKYNRINQTLNNNYDDLYDFGDFEDEDMPNEAGELIQESNTRPLLPGQIPFEILKAKNTTTAYRPQNEYNKTQANQIFFVPAMYQPRPFEVPVVGPGNQQSNKINRYNYNYPTNQERPIQNRFTTPKITTIRFNDKTNLHQRVPPKANATPPNKDQAPETPDKEDVSKLNVITPTNLLTTSSTRKTPVTISNRKSTVMTNSPVSHKNNRPKVTSLPIDTHASTHKPITNVMSSIQVNNVGSQTELPFNKAYMKPTNRTEIPPTSSYFANKVNDSAPIRRIKKPTAQRPRPTKLPHIDLNIGEFPPPGYTANANITNEMEIMKPPPITNVVVMKKPNANMEPPKIEINSPSGDIYRVPNLSTKKPADLDAQASTRKPYVPKPSEEMEPPPVGLEEVLGMSPPPPITTHRPMYILKPATHKPVYSLELDPPKTEIRYHPTYTHETTSIANVKTSRPRRPHTRKPTLTSSVKPVFDWQKPVSLLNYSTEKQNGVHDVWGTTAKPLVTILPLNTTSNAPNFYETPSEDLTPPKVSFDNGNEPSGEINKPSYNRQTETSTYYPSYNHGSANLSNFNQEEFATFNINQSNRSNETNKDSVELQFNVSVFNKTPSDNYLEGFSIALNNSITHATDPVVDSNTTASSVSNQKSNVEVVDSKQSQILPTPTLKIEPTLEVIIGHPNLEVTPAVKHPQKTKHVEILGSMNSVGERLDGPTQMLDRPSTILKETKNRSDIYTSPAILEVFTTGVHHSGNEVKIIDEPSDVVPLNEKTNRTIISKVIRIRPISTKYVTYTTTSTVTVTETKTIKTAGGPPSIYTILVTKTEKVTKVDTITEFVTLLKPTNIFEVVTTTVNHFPSTLYPPGVNYGNEYPGFSIKPTHVAPSEESTVMSSTEDDIIISPPGQSEISPENESILVVLTDKNKGSVLSIDKGETQNRDEILDTNQVNKILVGGISIASLPSLESPIVIPHQSRCNPECRASKNELCQRIEGLMRCVCRPGFARMFPDHPCKPTYTYTLKIELDRYGKEKLLYHDGLGNQNSSEYVRLASITHEGLDRMVMQSDLRDIYHGVSLNGFESTHSNDGLISNFNLQLSDNTEEMRLMDIFKRYLRNNNYSLGGTELFASKENLDRLEAEDFNECANMLYNDCSEHAQCFNLGGTYTCSCKEGYADLSENVLYPGRICSAEIIGCERCNYHGTCYNRGDDQIICECFQWYAGERCHINLKVLLIALVTLGIVLFVLLLICIILTCCRRSPKAPSITNGMSFLPQRVASRNSKHSAMDKRAMIPDTSSESGHSDTNTLPYIAKQKPKKLKGALKKPSAPMHSDIENGNISSLPDQKDRSLTVMIPRAKYHPVPPTSPRMNLTTFDKRKISASSNETKVLSYVDAGPAPNKVDQRKFSNGDSYIEEQPIPRKTSGALISAGFEVSATVLGNNMGTLGTIVTTCGTEADRSENATLIQKISADLLSSIDTKSQYNTLRNDSVDEDLIEDPMANWMDTRVTTVSEARSYDETTIQPPMKSFRNDYDSKPSSQIHNDETLTMAERDLGSTFLLPHTHLYKPDRGSDISGFESL